MAATQILILNSDGGYEFSDMGGLSSSSPNIVSVDTATRNALVIPADTIPIVPNSDTNTLQFNISGIWYDVSSKQYAE